jgi:L-fuconolactonase
MRIDAHHHFWKLGRYHYPWMQPDLKAIHQDFGPAELEPLLKKHRLDRTVLVQTISSLDETKWFLSLAQQHSFIAGVVGWVDLKDPAVGGTLDELLAGPGLVGIRHAVHDEPAVDWLFQAEVQRGLGELARRRLPYDLLIRPPHLPVCLRLARDFPTLPLVVDHLAKPRVALRGWDDWAKGLADLARFPNVWCKLSGLITEADWAAWKPTELQPYVDHVLDVFGVDRVMFGSDWPVCLLAGSYDRVVAAFASNIAQRTELERQKIFGTNAARFYGLTPLP